MDIVVVEIVVIQIAVLWELAVIDVVMDIVL